MISHFSSQNIGINHLTTLHCRPVAEECEQLVFIWIRSSLFELIGIGWKSQFLANLTLELFVRGTAHWQLHNGYVIQMLKFSELIQELQTITFVYSLRKYDRQ